MTHDPEAGPPDEPTCAGFGTAVGWNARFKQLIAHGTTALSVTFDLPTRTGHDSDTPAARGEVGRAGVAVDSIDDMRVLFGGIPLGEVSTSMTADAPAAVLLLLYQLVAEEQGVAADRLTGAIRNGVPWGPYIFPPEPSLRLSDDLFGYCRAEIPGWRTITVPRTDPGGPEPYEPFHVDPSVGTQQAERLCKLRAWREQSQVDAALARLRKAALGADNVLYPMKDALLARATVGEVCGALRAVWGTSARRSGPTPVLTAGTAS
ncbi:methylmalonyl-CoA mutase family protein [Streptomyces sp. SID13726]|uniref:methylmalonyl-CoA mutase family protein n=1 Tax=Streptomyces sp. SID13726 TaxID=2706058 RepID=UPI0013BC7121|nr:methylmalonyl-CoA mutase family protein [Streptomyces sp. SID13726]NEB02426.1 hypothetical protein [Streptomyces sp. SID13726]